MITFFQASSHRDGHGAERISQSGGWELNVWVFVNLALSPVVHEIEGPQVLLDYTWPNVSKVQSALTVQSSGVSGIYLLQLGS